MSKGLKSIFFNFIMSLKNSFLTNLEKFNYFVKLKKINKSCDTSWGKDFFFFEFLNFILFFYTAGSY